MKQRSKVIATSIATIAMCASLAVGGTFALFTSESEVNVAVTSGTVDVKATADKATLKYTSSLGKPLTESSATIEKNVVKIDKIVPGDTISFDLVIENYSNVTVQYQTVLSLVDGVDLFTGLQIEVDKKVYDGMTAYSNWTELNPIDGENKEFDRIPVTITLPESAGDEYQNKTAEISFIVKAVQGNAAVEQPASDENTLYVYSENDMKLFAHSVNKGNNFSGKTVMLMSDVDLNNEAWTPIGNSTNNFQGTFDGNGKTVSNLYVEGEEGLGLFGYTWTGSYIHSLTIDGAYVSGKNYLGAVVGTGYFKQNGVQNCVVKNAEIIATPYLMDNGIYDHGAKAGVVAGYVNNGNVCGNSAMDSSVSAYRDLGGIAGMTSGEDWAVVAENNSVENITLTYLASPNGKYEGNKVNQNMGDIVGRIKNTTVEKNTASKMTYNFENVGTKESFTSALSSSATNINVMFNNANVEWATGAEHGSTPFGKEDTKSVTINGQSPESSTFTATGSGVGPIRVKGGTLTIQNVTIIDESVSYAEDSWEFGYLEFGDENNDILVFENCVFKNAIQISGNASFKNCKFNSGVDSEYAVWVNGGNATFEDCYFTGSRGLKMHEAYGSEGVSVTVENCKFENLTKKPGIAMGTLNAATSVTIKNSEFIDCQAGDQGLYIYETDTDVTTFTFVNENNVVGASVSDDEELNTAIQNGIANISLGAGNYAMPEPDLRGKTLTITGTKDTVIDVSNVDARDQFVTGATVVFDGVTLNFGKVNYMGFANTKSLTYRNCKINGLQFLYGENVTFENCEFDSNGAEHCVWTYGAKNVSFTDCKFTYGDRGINCYSDNDVVGGKQTVNFTKCTFTTENAASGGAVEINSSYFSVGIEVNMEGCNAPAYGQMAYVSPWDSTNGAKTTINIK